VKEEGKNKITTPKGVIESNEESKNFEITSKCTLQDETLISPRAIKCSSLEKIFYSWLHAMVELCGLIKLTIMSHLPRN